MSTPHEKPGSTYSDRPIKKGIDMKELIKTSTAYSVRNSEKISAY